MIKRFSFFTIKFVFVFSWHSESWVEWTWFGVSSFSWSSFAKDLFGRWQKIDTLNWLESCLDLFDLFEKIVSEFWPNLLKNQFSWQSKMCCYLQLKLKNQEIMWLKSKTLRANKYFKKWIQLKSFDRAHFIFVKSSIPEVL